MTLKIMSAPITIRNGNSTFTFLSRGDSFEWLHESVMINAFRGNTLNGSTNNIYLRLYKENTVKFYPLIGLASNSLLKSSSSSLIFEGTVEQISYIVTFRLTPYGIWFWDITLNGNCDKADVVYSQDIGIGSKGSINSNELYNAQYLGHSIFNGDFGYVICSRQNMSQEGANPYLQQGSLGIRSLAYSTDGTQFFGLSYKKTNVPEALLGDLPSINKQYELSHTALQTETFSISGSKHFSFYGICKTDHPDIITEIEYKHELESAYTYSEPQELQLISTPSLSKIGSPYSSTQWDTKKISEYFPSRCLEEKSDNTLLSFFTSSKSHVVLQSKELITDRPHGHILMTNFDLNKVPQGVISTTNYMYGAFNCQLVVGNTSFNKLLSNHRGLLNTDKNSGQRIFVKIGDLYRQLTLPAAYEMDLSGSTWYYQLEDDILIVTSFVMYNRPEVVLNVHSVNNQKYDFIVTHQLSVGPGEYENDIELNEEGNIIQIRPSLNAMTQDFYPELHFRMKIPNDSSVSDDRIFFDTNTTMNPSLLTVTIPNSSNFDIVIQSYDCAEEVPFLDYYDYSLQKEAYHEHYNRLTCNFMLSSEKDQVSIQKLNTIISWYAHDALIHFASPHGLEQSGGAAWGTRDICQGPVEFFLTTQHYDLVRHILITLFSHQMTETYEWPQWFMFDRYTIHQEDCHGDIVFWPLKAIGDYICTTGDSSILDEIVDYCSLENEQATKAPESILSHIKHAISNIKNRYLPGTALISYAGGDWDDTLQPTNNKLRENLVSAWTQILATQVLEQLSKSVLEKDPELSSDISHMAMDIQESFNKYLIKDGVIAGFLYRESDEMMKYMLHPTDRETSIHYRLLPLTRSIIAQLADTKLATRNMEIIDEHLSCPDGVRLMDHPASYNGGNSQIFLRAEQAANVGREISLQYVHAHIRYIEASAVLGLPDRAWDALMRVTPILLTDYVPNAITRQSNVYYSSSEGCFNDRYEYAANFDKLRTGDIKVKGGWRLYSSGPGIYIRRMVSDLLGIRFNKNNIHIDPIITKDLDGATFQFNCYGKTVFFTYHLADNMNKPISVLSDGKELPGYYSKNRYRDGGIEISKDIFIEAAEKDTKFHVYVNAIKENS